MSNHREYIVISRDGTFHLASDCIVLHANAEQIETLSKMADNERFAIVQQFEDSSKTVEDIAYELIMKEE